MKLSWVRTLRNRHGALILAAFIVVIVICALAHVLWEATIYIILMPFLLYIRFNRNYNKAQGASENPGVTLTIDPEGVGISGEGLNSKLAWKYAKSCKQNDKYIFFRLQKSSMVFPIPKRCFPSEAEAKAFYDDLQHYVSKG